MHTSHIFKTLYNYFELFYYVNWLYCLVPKRSTKKIIRDSLIYSELLTTPLTTIHDEVLVAIKEKDFRRYLPPMKSDMC